jgi:hypothetical protein
MPQELALILVVLGIVGWVIYGIAKAFIEGTRPTHKEISGLLTRANESRFQKKKRRLQAAVHI